MKLGGLNFDIDLLSDENIRKSFGTHPLIIGVSLCHLDSVNEVQKARGGAVTEVNKSGNGYCANVRSKSLIDFVGDHYPARAYRNENYDVVANIVHQSVRKFELIHERLPSSITLYVNGSSEGDFQIVSAYYKCVVNFYKISFLDSSLSSALDCKRIAENYRRFDTVHIYRSS